MTKRKINSYKKTALKGGIKQMENAGLTLVIISFIALLVGFGSGALLLGGETEVEVPGETITVIECSDGSFVDDSANCPQIALALPINNTEIVEIEVEVPMDLEEEYLNPAIDDLFDELDRDDDFLTCGDFEYDDSEIDVTKIYQWSYTWFDDDEYQVDFEAKFRFDEDDERSCKETRAYSLFYEDGEDVEVELIE